MNVLSGSAEVFPLPEVFLLLSRSKVTGALRLARDNGDASVFFRDGQIYDAVSSSSRDLNRRRLVEAKQIQDTILDVVHWDAGDFSFEHGETSPQDVGLQMTVENLLMESSRQVEEWDVIRRRIPSPLTVPKMSPTAPVEAERITIHPEEWPLLVLADGSRTVAEIAVATGKSEFDASRILYGFVSAGLLGVIPSISGGSQLTRARSDPDPTVTVELLGRLKAGVEAL